MKQLVIGYGNQLRGDDGFGYTLVSTLASDLHDVDVDTIVCHQLTPELIDPLRYVQRVIFVDAREGDMPGQIVTEAISPVDNPDAFTHNTTPEALLRGVEAWYGVQPEGYLLTVTGEDFGFSESLSPTVQRVLSDAINTLYALLKKPVSANGKR